MGTKVNLIMAYHPLTDGQMERIIQTLEDIPWACAPDFSENWSEHLLLVEFSYDKSYHNGIGMAPYENLYEKKYQSPLYWDEVGEKVVIGPWANPRTMDKVAIIKEKLNATQDRHKIWADLKRRPMQFEIGEHAYVNVSPMKGVFDSARLEAEPQICWTL